MINLQSGLSSLLEAGHHEVFLVGSTFAAGRQATDMAPRLRISRYRVLSRPVVVVSILERGTPKQSFGESIGTTASMFFFCVVSIPMHLHRRGIWRLLVASIG